MWRWGACALSRWIFHPPEYVEGADHPLQLPYRVEVEGYGYVHGGRRGGPPIWAYLTNTRGGNRCAFISGPAAH